MGKQKKKNKLRISSRNVYVAKRMTQYSTISNSSVSLLLEVALALAF